MKRSGHWAWTCLTGPYTVLPLSQRRPILSRSRFSVRWHLIDISFSLQPAFKLKWHVFKTSFQLNIFHTLIGASMSSVVVSVSPRDIKSIFVIFFFSPLKWSSSRCCSLQNYISQNSLNWSVGEKKLFLTLRETHGRRFL